MFSGYVVQAVADHVPCRVEVLGRNRISDNKVAVALPVAQPSIVIQAIILTKNHVARDGACAALMGVDRRRGARRVGGHRCPLRSDEGLDGGWMVRARAATPQIAPEDTAGRL